MTDVTETSDKKPAARWRLWLRLVLGLALGAGAVTVVVRAAGGVADLQDALRRTDPWWLVPAVAFEALSYVLSGLRLRRLAGTGVDLTVVSATELELVVNGLGLLTPASPAEGLAFATAELSRRGLPRRRILFTLGFSSWFSFRIFYLAGALNLLFMVATRDVPIDATWALVVAPLVLVLLTSPRWPRTGRAPPSTSPWCSARCGSGSRDRPATNGGRSALGSTPTPWPSWARAAVGSGSRSCRSPRC